MHAMALPMIDFAGRSAIADLLYRFLCAAPARWIRLDPARIAAELHLSEPQLDEAVDQLHAAGLVERAPFGPLVYVTPRALTVE